MERMQREKSIYTESKKLYFPMFVDLSDKRVIIIGGGRIGRRRAKSLCSFADNVTIITKEVSEELEALAAEEKIIIKHKAFEVGDIYEADIVVAATDSDKINNDIHGICKSLGITVNVASDKSKCDFYFPGIILDEDIVVGVSANGRDHKMAKSVTEKIRRCL
jgi:precorrin-2 dehydrogenase/sirohydrochlorin ferrochelatase